MLLNRKIINFFKNIFTTAVILLATLFFLTTFGSSEQYKLFAVRSGSMRPAISEGDLILAVKQENYKKGDIIAYNKKGATVTHRIVDLQEKDGESFFITKGDANDKPDDGSVRKEQIFGKVKGSLLFLGRIVLFSKTQAGFILLIVIPGTVIAYSEILGIFERKGSDP